MNRKISHDDYLKAKGLFHLAQEHYRKGHEFEAALATLLGYDETYMGRISDAVIEGESLEFSLKKEKISVSPTAGDDT